MKGIEGISLHGEGSDENNENIEEEENELFVDSVESLWSIDFHTLSANVATKYEFGDLEVAYTSTICMERLMVLV